MWLLNFLIGSLCVAEANLPICGSRAVPAPEFDYTLHLGEGEKFFEVALTVRNPPDTLSLVMAVHPEYDDRFWRFVSNLEAKIASTSLSIVRQDSNAWRAIMPSGYALSGAADRSVVIRYRITPPAPRPGLRMSWRAFIGSNGALIGGPHSFIYLRNHAEMPARVHLDLPSGWRVATGLEARGKNDYYARDFATLVDNPIMTGQLKMWSFTTASIKHAIAYWPLDNATPFDTVAFTRSIEALAGQAVRVFGTVPYYRFTFLFVDGAYGGLEHRSSVTLGAPSAALAKDPTSDIGEWAHEYFHSWNLVALQPAGWRFFSHQPAATTTGLWLSEGVTLFYADLLVRRAGYAKDSRREALARVLERYLNEPGNVRISPEQASAAADTPGRFGDSQPDVYAQGEAIGNALDFLIRDSSDGRRTLDDAMRLLYQRRAGTAGFTTADAAQAASEACGCDLQAFFRRYVQAADTLDFARWVQPLGFRLSVTSRPATDDSGRAEPDLRVWAYAPSPAQPLAILISHPDGVWGRAGLHTGDALLSWNGAVPATLAEFSELLKKVKLGDQVDVEYRHGEARQRVAIAVKGYERTEVKLEEVAEPSARQTRLQAAWAERP